MRNLVLIILTVFTYLLTSRRVPQSFLGIYDLIMLKVTDRLFCRMILSLLSTDVSSWLDSGFALLVGTSQNDFVLFFLWPLGDVGISLCSIAVDDNFEQLNKVVSASFFTVKSIFFHVQLISMWRYLALINIWLCEISWFHLLVHQSSPNK